jgi:hypothetical protein
MQVIPHSIGPFGHSYCVAGESWFARKHAVDLTRASGSRLDLCCQGQKAPALLSVIYKLTGAQSYFEGDGSFQVTAQEPSTIIHKRLDIIIFLMNNNGYTIERLIQAAMPSTTKSLRGATRKAPVVTVRPLMGPTRYRLQRERLGVSCMRFLQMETFRPGVACEWWRSCWTRMMPPRPSKL